MPVDRMSGNDHEAPTLIVGEYCDASRTPDVGHPPFVMIGQERPVAPSHRGTTKARGLDDYRDADTTFVEAAEEADTLIKEWAGAPCNTGRTLAEETGYEGVPLWQAVEFNLLYGHLAALVDELRLWDRILEIEKPREVVLLPDQSSEVPELIARSRGIGVRRVGSPGRGDVASDSARRTAPWENLPLSLTSWMRRWRSRARSSRARRFNQAHARAIEADPNTLRILVLTVVERFAEVSIPVIKILAQGAANDVLVIDRNFSTASPRLESEGIPFHIFEGYANRATNSVYRDGQRSFHQAWLRISDDPSFQRQIAWRDVGLWPLIGSVLNQYFDALFPEMARIIAVTRNLLSEEQPDVVVVTDERPPFQRAFVRACRMEGVPTVGIQDTLFPDLPYGSPISTDWLAIEGEVARDNLAKRGTPRAKTVITGQPRFDFLVDIKERNRRDTTLEALGLDPRQKTVLVVSQYAGIYFRATDKRRVFEAISSALAQVREIQVIVKLHPDEADGSIERDFAENASLPQCRIVEGGDIVEYLLASDLVIVFFSTVGHEAILLGKPLIQIPVGSGEGTIIPFTEEGGALEGADLTELPSLVQAALFDPRIREDLRRGREAYVHRHVHALDGRSAERVAELVVRVAHRERR